MIEPPRSARSEAGKSSELPDRVPCPLCGAAMSRRRVGAAELELCPWCGLGRVPLTGERPDFWEAGAHDELENDYWTRARSRMFRLALSRLAGLGERGSLVDVGGGVGHFAQCALQEGWDAYTTDLSPAAREAAAQRVGDDRSLTPEQAAERAGGFDVATLWCVVAHVPDPVGLVRSTAGLLKPGGRLLVTTPNFVFQGSLARLLDRAGRPYDLVCRDHILHFTPAALSRLLELGGLAERRFDYFGSTDHCFFSPRAAGTLIPLKRIWNFAGSSIARLGLPPISSELQVLATKRGTAPPGA